MKNFSIKDLSSFFLKYIGKEMPYMGDLAPVVLTDVMIGVGSSGELNAALFFNGECGGIWALEDAIKWIENMFTEED